MFELKISSNTSEINRNKFHDELLEKVENEFSLKHCSEYILLIFKGVNETKHYNENDIYTHSTYTKDNYVDVEDKEGNVIGQKNVPVDFTSEMNSILLKIQTCIENHDPTPPTTPITDAERLEALEQALMEVILNG